jgi:hypothetical protein
MEKLVPSLNRTLNSDSWWQAFINTKAIIEPVTFGVQSAGSSDAVLVSVSPGAKTNVTTGNPSKADFVLAAEPEQWEKFFTKDPKAPYTSFVGLQVCAVLAKKLAKRKTTSSLQKPDHRHDRVVTLRFSEPSANNLRFRF